MNGSERSMSVMEIANEALHQLTLAISRRNAYRARLNEQGIVDPDAVHFDSDAERQAFDATGHNFWKEVTIGLTDRELAYTPAQILNEHIVPAVACLADWLYQREHHSPLGMLPVYDRAGLALAVASDPTTGHSLRVRRWESTSRGCECLAFDMCSMDYRPQSGLVTLSLTD